MDTDSYNFCRVSLLHLPAAVDQAAVEFTARTARHAALPGAASDAAVEGFAAAPGAVVQHRAARRKEDVVGGLAAALRAAPVDASTQVETESVVHREHLYVDVCMISMKHIMRCRLCAIAGPDRGLVNVWDMQTGTLHLQFGGTDSVRACGMAMCVQLLEDATHAQLQCVAGFEDGSVGLWVADAPHTPRQLVRVHEQPVMAMAAHSVGLCIGANVDARAAERSMRGRCNRWCVWVGGRDGGVLGWCATGCAGHGAAAKGRGVGGGVSARRAGGVCGWVGRVGARLPV